MRSLVVLILAICLASPLVSERISADPARNVTEQQIAQVEARVDAYEATALAQAAAPNPGSPQRVAALGKVLFFDKNLSVNRNTACAFCHMPETGYQGAIESINLAGINQPGSVRTRFSLRKPPTAAYAAFSPPLFYPTKPGQAKCSHCFIGGNFWDVRATGLRLQSPSAEQAEGSPLNPTEMANRDPACVVRRISQSRYRSFFEQVFGPRSFAVDWPAGVDDVCSLPNNNPSSAIGSEVPGPNTTPLVVKLGPADRSRVAATFDAMARAIAAFEASPEVSPFSSKFDAYLAGKVQLSSAEQSGYALFNGKAKCLNCHVDPKGQPHPLFTDETTLNLGLPRNPDLAFYRQTKPDAYGYVGDARGERYLDKGMGDFLRSPAEASLAWQKLAPGFDGRFHVATLRNVDMRPRPNFVKAYMHNGYLKSLKEVVHFYNTRDTLPKCAAGAPGEKVSCWPPPEDAVNLNTNCCDLGLTSAEEDDVVAFMKALSDGYSAP